VPVRVVSVRDLVREAVEVNALVDGAVRRVGYRELLELAYSRGGVLVSACADCTGTLVRLLWTRVSPYRRELEGAPRSPFASRTVYVVPAIACAAYGVPAQAEYVYAPWRMTREEVEALARAAPQGPRARIEVHDARTPIIPFVPGLTPQRTRPAPP